MKLVEEAQGVGELLRNGQALAKVRYRIDRYQGFDTASGLPIPGLFRIDGSIAPQSGSDLLDWVGQPLALRLEDGRALAITVVSSSGRVLSEGHGPAKCLCC